MKNPVTEKLITAIKKQVSPAPPSEEIAFLRDFYHRISGQDFTVDSALEFRALALRHRQLAAVRPPGKPLLEIYNSSSTPTSTTTPTPKTRPDAARQDTTVILLVTDDRPFLIDSLTIKLNALHKTPQRVVHPNFEVWRDPQHRAQKMLRGTKNSPQPNPNHTSTIECYLQLIIDFTEEKHHAALARELRAVLDEVEMVVHDWSKMRANTLALARQIDASDTTPNGEPAQLLKWMEADNFAFLGYAEIEIDGTTATTTATPTPTLSVSQPSLLGILRAHARAHPNNPNAAMDILPPPNIPTTQQNSPMVITKSRRRATIHRANYLDCILITQPHPPAADKYKVHCIIGFIAGLSQRLPTMDIPHVRVKTERILSQSTLRSGGYAYKKLQLILETLPREKFFQMETDDLYRLAMTVLNHIERRITRAHLHRDLCGHFYSCLVYIPRDLFNSTLRQRIQDFLRAQFAAEEVSFRVYFSDFILTRIHYLIHCDQQNLTATPIDPAKLEREIQSIARDWNENLYETLHQRGGHKLAQEMLAQYRDAFDPNYQNHFSLTQAALDIERFSRLQPGEIHAALTFPKAKKAEKSKKTEKTEQPNTGENTPHPAHFRIYSHDTALALSDVLPILQNMGIRILSERPYRLQRQDGSTCWLQDLAIVCPPQMSPPTESATDSPTSNLNTENFQTTFIQAWYGNIENDAFNQLTARAGLDWREVNLLRAYYRYLKQIRLRYSEQYSIDALLNNPRLATSLVQFFAARFNPNRRVQKNKTSNGKKGTRKLKSDIRHQLAEVATLDEERIIRAFFDVISATVRTNYYQRDANGAPKPYLSLKLAPTTIPHIPQPAPQYEIFVCSPRMEGAHLRGGKVARGGLRWSDRNEDFRTEVLGLAKAQHVKNSLIVPVGSKGGFIVKRPPPADAERSAIRHEVVACYQLLISGMLDLTDNLVGEKIIPPSDVIRKDGDDPYLVVAADKGTATFSDIANELSAQYGFWLGDAFASGGSSGYDHKKMGITARGAWESVKRHFRELGKDIQRTDFTVIGIGDMAGDVFGNGMLLSRHIRLIAAFNHAHIFIDPNPDAARSYRERKRLFALPRSSWNDYDRALLSPGGGIYPRSAKSIPLSREARKALGASKDKYPPEELIHTILKAEVELLWNGGIGTYVKASSETHATVQDKSNDGLRVDAAKLRCQVIGEGGNLGMTQHARVEFAQHGGRCYTDAIDNSAGVDTSDHEVNIKILLNAALQSKALTPAKRNALLAEMEDEIAHLVLRNNYTQTQTISMQAARARQRMPQHCRTIAALEEKGLLNRALEFLPDDAALETRREQGKYLTRAELAVLLSYSKMDMYQALLASNAPDDEYLEVEINRYFPPRLAKQYPKLVRAHRLKREIISTQLTNQLVGMLGPNFHLRLTRLLGCDTAHLARAYVVARELLDAPAIAAEIEALDNKIPAQTQMEMLEEVAATLERCIIWLARSPNPATEFSIRKTITTLHPGCADLKKMLATTLTNIGGTPLAMLQKRSHKLQKHGAPPPLAEQISALPLLGYAVDIVELSHMRKRPLPITAAVYFRLRETLALDWIEQSIDSLPLSNAWHERAHFRLATDLRASHSAITAKILADKSTATNTTATTDQAAAALTHWTETNQTAIASIASITTALKTEPTPDFAMLSVLLGELARMH